MRLFASISVWSLEREWMLLASSPGHQEGQETAAVYQCRISSVAFAALTSFSSHGDIWKLREEEEIAQAVSLIFGLKPPFKC